MLDNTEFELALLQEVLRPDFVSFMVKNLVIEIARPSTYGKLYATALPPYLAKLYPRVKEMRHAGRIRWGRMVVPVFVCAGRNPDMLAFKAADHSMGILIGMEGRAELIESLGKKDVDGYPVGVQGLLHEFGHCIFLAELSVEEFVAGLEKYDYALEEARADAFAFHACQHFGIKFREPGYMIFARGIEEYDATGTLTNPLLINYLNGRGITLQQKIAEFGPGFVESYRRHYGDFVADKTFSKKYFPK